MIVAQHVENGDAWKVLGAENVDGAITCRAARDRVGAEGLLIRSVDLFADDAERFSGAQIRLHDVAVGDRQNLRAGVKVLSKTGHARVGVGGERRVVLVEVLRRQRVFAGDVVVQISHGHVCSKAAGAGQEGVVLMSDRRSSALQVVIRDQPVARFTGQRRGVE